MPTNSAKGLPTATVAQGLTGSDAANSHEQAIKALINHATTFERTKELRSAHRGFVEAKLMTKKHFGTDHRLYAECLHNLALFHHTLGRYSFARAYSLKALEVLTKILTSKQLHDDQMWQDLLLLLHHL